MSLPPAHSLPPPPQAPAPPPPRPPPAHVPPRRFNSPYVTSSCPLTTATAPGPRSTCSSNNSTTVFSPYSSSVRFHSSKISSRSSSLNISNSPIRFSGPPTICFNNCSQCPSIRSIVFASYNSVLYSTLPLIPSASSSSIVSVMSNFAVSPATMYGSTESPPNDLPVIGAFSSTIMVWNSGDRLRSLAGFSSSTNRSNGRSWCP